jgi:hypothetical protein
MESSASSIRFAQRVAAHLCGNSVSGIDSIIVVALTIAHFVCFSAFSLCHCVSFVVFAWLVRLRRALLFLQLALLKLRLDSHVRILIRDLSFESFLLHGGKLDFHNLFLELNFLVVC